MTRASGLVAVQQPAPAGPSVLLVDDNPRLVPLVTRLLGLLGFPHVRVAGDATAARLALRSMPICLVICDIELPGPEDGLNLLRWTRGTEGLRDIPFIVTEESLTFSDVRAASELGADGILLKPFEADLFKKKIAAAASTNHRRRRLPRWQQEGAGRNAEANVSFPMSLYGLNPYRDD